MVNNPSNIICPNCESDKAYEGFQTIECPSYGCKYYTIKQVNLVKEYKLVLEEETALQLPELDGTVVKSDKIIQVYDDPYGFSLPP